MAFPSHVTDPLPYEEYPPPAPQLPHRADNYYTMNAPNLSSDGLLYSQLQYNVRDLESVQVVDGMNVL